MRLLIVDDENDHRGYLASVAKQWGYFVTQAANGAEALEVVREGNADVVLSDLVMPRMDGFELLKTMQAENKFPPTILMTAFGSLEKALKTIHELRGFWFLEKPVDLTALQLLLARAGAQQSLQKENDELRRQLAFSGVLGDLVGQTASMKGIFSLIRMVSPTQAPVLITGESGTGKELVARAVHTHSAVKDGPFIALNCAAMPDTLIESEIFGHEKGAFTGAFDKRIGALEAAQDGTLFLDELGEMPIALQAKLLRVLEDLKFRRLGGKQELQSNARIVAATNRDPLKAIEEGKLREDLYYRVNVFRIHLPPLRDRREDITPIVDSLVLSLNRKHGTQVRGASPEFHAAMQRLPWKGNVRELRNIVERAVIVAGEGLLQPQHAAFAMQSGPVEVAERPPVDPNAINISVGMTIDEAEKILIEATLAQAGNNKTRAAGVLGISTKTLHFKLRQYRIENEDAEAATG
jgi:DNA-binding NtrC family response regulator